MNDCLHVAIQFAFNQGKYGVQIVQQGRVVGGFSKATS